MVSDIMRAAPTPCATRAATSHHRSVAAPHSADASVKIAIPFSSSRRRPIRSPRRPALTTSAVIVSR
ncbi:hypothetical protein D9M68_995190 [compost metagenome]